MWIDHRGNWHIIGHAYNTAVFTNCSRSPLSTHFFSRNGKIWHLIAGVEPYGHTVHYDDGTSYTYSTLEQVNPHFDPTTGQMTHLTLAADLATGDEGCADQTWRRGKAPHCCSNCKMDDRVGTIVVALKTQP